MDGHGALWSRRATLAELAAGRADVLVIGGGIVGTGVARDAAMRGLDTVLVDRGDLGAGTSSRSSRLVHGGLRYLEQGALHLVFEASRERATLLAIAPHLVRPLSFVFPLHKGDRVPRWKLAAGLWLYDLLALFRNVGRHRMLGKRRLLEAEPMVRARGLVGGARYWDAQCDDARLVVATARGAIAHRARVANYVGVRALVREEDGGIAGAEVEDALTGERATVRARVVINATGPWADELRRLEDPHARPLLRLTKGVHVVVPRARVGHHEAIVCISPIDGRVMFVLPWGHLSYIGTTDTDVAAPAEEPSVGADDVLYLLRSANAHFPSARLTVDDVRATWAGLRPLLAEDGARPASSVSREHAIVAGPGGMITVAGGKLTTYRAMAAEVVDTALRRVPPRDGRAWPADAGTDREPLPGGEARELEPIHALGREAGFAPATLEHLLLHYGTEAAGIFNLVRGYRHLAEPIVPGHPAILGEVVHLVRRELAQRVDDVLVRRLHLIYETPDRGVSAAPRVARMMARELGWDEARVTDEVRRYAALAQSAALPDAGGRGALDLEGHRA